MAETITIAGRFNGPPNSGNGGYVCGRLGLLFDGPAEVTLKKPPPLDMAMSVARDDGGISLMDGDGVVAEAGPALVDLAIPEPPDLETARAAVQHYTGFGLHAFPTCFVCGPERRPGDGLCIFPGKVAGGDLVAAPWTPDASLADEAGGIDPVHVWAALDCPGYFAVADVGEAAVLGRMAAEVPGVPAVGETCVVIGWAIGGEGRKLHSGTAVFGADGRLIGKARATWIKLQAATGA
ncbi:MAG: hypothetical protein MI755_18435 [Sphingomonadales bacterium]|nr:hypothetical protein [Sphingomonadales bacterium]